MSAERWARVHTAISRVSLQKRGGGDKRAIGDARQNLGALSVSPGVQDSQSYCYDGVEERAGYECASELLKQHGKIGQ